MTAPKSVSRVGHSGSDMGPYSCVMRPLDEALPGELDLKGWDSDDNRDNRGPETCLSPSPVQQVRKKSKGSGAFPTRSSPPYSPLVNLGPPPNIWPTGALTGGGGGAGRSGKSR
jgi:hypothetical protein